jgi:hypothetical protein
MPPYVVHPCTIQDGPALARIHVAAFWTDPTWVVIWPGKTQEYVAEQSARRKAHRLLQNTTHERHQKAVDAETGTVVGYVRWVFPKVDAVDMASLWPEARVPPVTEEQALEAEREFSAADFSYDTATDELDVPIHAMRDRIKNGKDYISG